MYDKIPEEMKQLNQWVGVRNGSKVPMNPNADRAASIANPDTWSSFSAAVSAVERGLHDGIGFVFNDCGIVGLDIDTGFDSDGFVSDMAIDIISRCHSYTETSRSGRGFHILLKGDLPFKGKNNQAGLEIYKTARYFIVTGNTFLYEDIVDNQKAIDDIIAKYFPEVQRESGQASGYRAYSPVWQLTGTRIPVRPMYPKVSNGSRNVSMTSLAGQLHSLGCDFKTIYEEVSYANSRACDPKLSRYELETIINSVMRYAR